MTLSGSGTGVTTFSGVLSGAGGIAVNSGNWRTTLATHSFTNGLTVNGGLYDATGSDSNVAATGNSILGAATVTINGGTIKLARTSANNMTFDRTVTFEANGGTLWFSKKNQGGNFSIVTNAPAGSPAVVLYGTDGSATPPANANWGNPRLRVMNVSGSGVLRFDITGGALLDISDNRTWSVPVTLRGYTGADFDISNNTTAKTGRFGIDSGTARTLSADGGLTIENAMQISLMGQAHTINGNMLVAPGRTWASRAAAPAPSGTFRSRSARPWAARR